MRLRKDDESLLSIMTLANMDLILKYIVLIILSYKCVYSMDGEDIFSDNGSKSAADRCAIPFSPMMVYFLPVPYRANASGAAAAVITPDRDGHLSIGRGQSFRLSCSGNAFISPPACVHQADVTVRCVGGVTVEHAGERYEFDLFRCAALPGARLTAARAPCNGVVDGVFDVGFDAARPLPLYRVCFDAAAGRTLYAWTYADAPLFHSNEMSTTLPRFVGTEHFRTARMAELYDAQKQNDSMIPKDLSMTVGGIMAHSLGNSLVPGHLLVRNQFVYTFQQFATYFYENTAPLWSKFSQGVWKDVERLFMKNLYRFKGIHLIVAGTINLTHLKTPPKTDAYNPFVVERLGSIPVPLSIWRMVYNVRNKKGIVFIGLNSPFTRGKPTMHICEKIACPSRLGELLTKTNLIYCCTKESFEKAYGPLDPVVYQEF